MNTTDVCQLDELAQEIQKANSNGLKAQLQLIRHKSQPRIVVDASGSAGEVRLVFPYRISPGHEWDKLQLSCPSNIRPGATYPLPPKAAELNRFIDVCRWWFDMMMRPAARIKAQVWLERRGSENRTQAVINLGGPCAMRINGTRIYLVDNQTGAQTQVDEPLTIGSAKKYQHIVDKFRYAIAPELEPPQTKPCDRHCFISSDIMYIVCQSRSVKLVGLFVTDDHIVFRPAPEGTNKDDPTVAAVIKQCERWTFVAVDGQRLLYLKGMSNTALIAVPPDDVITVSQSLSLNDIDLINELLRRNGLDRLTIKSEKLELAK